MKCNVATLPLLVGQANPQPGQLSIQLKELEASGLVSKTVYPEIPPRTEYTLTKLGERVLPSIRTLQKLGEAFKKAMKASSI